jgi:hypothetical protein
LARHEQGDRAAGKPTPSTICPLWMLWFSAGVTDPPKGCEIQHTSLAGGLAINQSHVSLFPGTLPVHALARQLERREGDEYWATPIPLSSTLAFKRERSHVASSHGLDNITPRYGALIGILNFGWYFCGPKSFEIRIPNKRRLWIEAPQALILPISVQTRRYRFLLERI